MRGVPADDQVRRRGRPFNPHGSARRLCVNYQMLLAAKERKAARCERPGEERVVKLRRDPGGSGAGERDRFRQRAL